MNIRRLVAVAALIALALPAAAFGQAAAPVTVGTVVGRECAIAWGLPTTNTDGTPVNAPLGFKRYDQATPTPVPVPGTTVPVTNLAPPATGNAATTDPCGNATPGQHYSWVTAYYAAGGESPLAAAPTPWYLTLAPPAAPANVKAAVVGTTCTISWTPPTTNIDGTTLVGSALTPVSAPLTYLVYALPNATPVPVPGTTPPTVTIAPPVGGGNATASLACSAVPSQSNVWVAAQNVNGPGAVQPSPLAFGAVPSTPPGVLVR